LVIYSFQQLENRSQRIYFIWPSGYKRPSIKRGKLFHGRQTVLFKSGAGKFFMVISKKQIGRFLQKSSLIQLVDMTKLCVSILKNWSKNRQFLNEHPEFVPPPYFLSYDAYNHTSWTQYYHLGLSHSRLLKELIQKHVTGEKIKVCEWGCGPARVIRHLGEIEGFEQVELVGTDYNRDSINWCRENIKNIQFEENRLEPPLQLASGSLDCIYAISIFTHLSEEMHFLWIEELFRLLKPEGILIFTTHGDRFINHLSAAEKKQYDSGRLVAIDNVKEGKKHFAAFHPPRFIQTTLLKKYRIIEYLPNPDSYQLGQDVWVVGN